MVLTWQRGHNELMPLETVFPVTFSCWGGLLPAHSYDLIWAAFPGFPLSLVSILGPYLPKAVGYLGNPQPTGRTCQVPLTLTWPNHVTSFCQWDVSKRDTSRGLESTVCLSLLILVLCYLIPMPCLFNARTLWAVERITKSIINWFQLSFLCVITCMRTKCFAIYTAL